MVMLDVPVPGKPATVISLPTDVAQRVADAVIGAIP